MQKISVFKMFFIATAAGAGFYFGKKIAKIIPPVFKSVKEKITEE